MQARGVMHQYLMYRIILRIQLRLDSILWYTSNFCLFTFTLPIIFMWILVKTIFVHVSIQAQGNVKETYPNNKISLYDG